jgi:3-dehydroquinate synthase
MEPQRIDVATPSRPYTISLAYGLLDQISQVLESVQAPARRFVVSSPRVWKLHGERFVKALNAEPILVNDGERYKRLATVSFAPTPIAHPPW